MARPRETTDEHLLTAAAAVLAEVGPAVFTLARAADRAGVSAATYVKRFGSRQAVFLELNRRWVAEVGPGVSGAAADLSGADRVRGAVLWGVAEMDVPAHAANMLATLALDLTDPALGALLAQGWETLHRCVTRIVAEEAAAGHLPSAPEPDQAARMLLALVEGTRLAWCVQPDGSLDDRVRAHVDVLLVAWARPAG